MTRGGWHGMSAGAACLALLCGAAGAAEPVEVRIARLLSEAQAAGSAAEAQPKLQQARKLLDAANRTLDPVLYGFLHADCLRTGGRVAVVQWQRDPAQAGPREQARKLLGQAIDEYAALVKRCEDRLNRIEERYTRRDPSESPEWRRFSGYISRANYAEAWSHYNLGLVAADEKDRAARFRQGIERFRSFTANGYRNHVIVADCFLGQALCHYELKQYFQVLELLKPAGPDNTPAGALKRMTYLRMKAAQAYGSRLEAEDAAKQYFDSVPGSRALDAVELGMALDRARCLSVLADPKQNPQYHALFRARLDAVARRIYAHGEPWRTQLAEILGQDKGVTPFQCLSRAQALFEAGKYAEAAAQAEQGLQAAAAKTPTSVLADLRYAQAAAAWKQGGAVRAHRAAMQFLRHHAEDRRAAGLCSVAVQAGLQGLQAKPPLPRDELLESLTLLEAKFPHQPAAEKLPWYRAHVLLEMGRFAEAQQALAPVRPGSGAYLLAQYGLALAAVKRAEALGGAKPADARLLAGLLDESAAAGGRFVDAAAEGKLSAEEQQAAAGVIDVAVATARRYLELPAPRPAAALELLGRVEKLSSHRQRAARQRLGLRVRAHVQAGNLDEATRRLDELLGLPGGEDDQAAAVLAEIVPALTAEYDRLWEGGSAKAAEALGKQILRGQGVLLGHVSRSADAAVRSQEPAVRLGLADMLRKLRRYTEAAAHYRWLAGKSPRGPAAGAIRGLAICCEQTQQYDLAADQWRALAQGLEKSTEGWYEARYHWIWCLNKSGRRQRARQLLAYFRLQHPRIAIRQWQDRFDALAGEIGAEAPTSAPHETK